MLQRKAYYKLDEWRRKGNKKCLIVRGARQVGKTYAIRQFAEANYDELLEINFKETPSAAEIFSGDLSVDSILMAMRFRYRDKKIAQGKTLIFLDEIQECSEAITSLKFWTEDGRYDVVASGSMLGLDYNRASSYPVGYVEFYDMYGLDFEEFLWSQHIGSELTETLHDMYEEKRIVPEAVHKELMQTFRLYTALGGMPEVVQRYVETDDIREADKIQRDLLQGYIYDIAHYAVAEEKVKAEKCYMSLSKQLLDKENHKFQYKEVETGGRAQKYYSSIEWLIKADIVKLCRLVADIRCDLDDYARNEIFRVYTSDISLLIAMKDYALKQHICENTLTGNTKGGIYESAIADILIKKSYPMYYYKNDTTKKEVDFLIQKEGKIIPIEVKSGNTKATSLKSLTAKWPELTERYKFIDGNVGVGDDGIITLPLYMAMFL